ncbi:MAG: HNH endonuclease [Clostridia bacterium]|nr:HNH endonuclease [Clostridia bacterium]
MKNKLISFCVVVFIIFFVISLPSGKDSDNNMEEYEDLTVTESPSVANNEQTKKGFGIGQIVALSVSGVILVTFCIIVIINYKKCKLVLKNSERIKKLLELNQTINFRRIQSRYNNQQECNSKRQLDHLSLDDYLIGLIASNESFYRNIVEAISYNRNTYYDYIRQAESIKTTATEEFCKELGFSLKRFLKYENRIFKWKKLRKPQFNVTVHCKVTYTSPQGRNHYWKEESYNFDELKRLYDHTVELKIQRQTRQYQIKIERAKMTDSLRYDILKRDGFRCQICGSCASDGVKLHVDHIIPVAKGGQTVASNLRTLCDRCNMGKSDKM